MFRLFAFFTRTFMFTFAGRSVVANVCVITCFEGREEVIGGGWGPPGCFGAFECRMR